MPQIFGIVNLTADSFSDGGRFLAPTAALEHAQQLVRDGADVIDLGAESTHPDGQDVPAEEEIARLTPVVEALRSAGVTVSVDTRKAAVMRAMLALGVEIINDVCGFRDPGAIPAVRDSAARLVVMYSLTESGRAGRPAGDPERVVADVGAFFRERVATLTAAGVARERIILDPGMGFFVGSRPEVSVALLRGLAELRAAAGLPLMVSVSRKSFLGVLAAGGGGGGGPVSVGGSAGAGGPRPIAERGAATLAAELWAARQGVEYIRTHDVRALRDGLRVWAALGGRTGGA